MSSRTFAARTTHSPNDPQLCGLSESSLCCGTVTYEKDGDEVTEEIPGAILKDEDCIYLTCKGDQASPLAQIQSSKKKDGYDTGYRVIPSGRFKEYTDRRGVIHKKPIFKWQEQGPNGRWHDVKVWERMVHVDCAVKLGYFVSGSRTTAFAGNRTKGHAHTINPTPISGLEELAAATYEADQAEEQGA